MVSYASPRQNPHLSFVLQIHDLLVDIDWLMCMCISSLFVTVCLAFWLTCGVDTRWFTKAGWKRTKEDLFLEVLKLHFLKIVFERFFCCADVHVFVLVDGLLFSCWKELIMKVHFKTDFTVKLGQYIP